MHEHPTVHPVCTVIMHQLKTKCTELHPKNPNQLSRGKDKDPESKRNRKAPIGQKQPDSEAFYLKQKRTQHTQIPAPVLIAWKHE